VKGAPQSPQGIVMYSCVRTLWHTCQGHSVATSGRSPHTRAMKYGNVNNCEHVYLLAMTTCSYLCKQQRIRRQESSGPSYYSSRSGTATHCDHVAARINSTNRRRVLTERHSDLWIGSELRGLHSCFTLWGRRACRCERRGAAKLLNYHHATLHHHRHTQKSPHLIYHCWPTAPASRWSPFSTVHFPWLLMAPYSHVQPRNGRKLHNRSSYWKLRNTETPRITRLIRSQKSSRNTKTRKVNNW
jgi:hypothetical protein